MRRHNSVASRSTLMPEVRKTSGEHKRKLFAPLHGTAQDAHEGLQLLEIGAGTGANFAYYPDNTKLTCIDPNPHLDDFIEINSSKYPKV